MGMFDDLIPGQKQAPAQSASGIRFDDLVPQTQQNVQSAPEVDYRAQLDAEYNPAQRGLINFGRGMTDLGQGAYQAALEGTTALGITDPERLEKFNESAQQERELFERGDIDEGAAAKTARFAGQVAPTLAIPGATAGMGLGARLATNAAAGGATGGLQYVEEDDSRLSNIGLGAAGGAAGGELVRGLIRGSVRATDAVRRATSPVQRRAVQVVSLIGDDAPESTKRRAIELVSEGLTPEQAARTANLEELGIQPTRGQITRRLADAQFENRAMSQADETAEPIRARVQQQNRAMLNELDDRVARQGGQVDEAFDVGESVRGGVQAGKAARHAETDQAYTALRESLPSDTPVKVGNLKTELDDALDFVVETPALDGIARRLRRFGVLDSDNQVVGDLTVEQAETVRRLLNDRMQGAGRQTAMALRRVRDALTKDVEASLGDDVYKPARSVAQREFSQFDNRRIVRDLLDEKIAPDDVVRRVTGRSAKTKDVAELVDTLSNNPGGEQALRDLRSGVMRHIRDNALQGRQMNLEGDPLVAGANFVKEVRNVGRPKLEAIFGGDEAQDLMRVANLMHSITNRPRNVGSSANTAETLESIINVTRSAGNIPGLSTITEPWVRRMRDRAMTKGVRAALDPVRSVARQNRRASTAARLRDVERGTAAASDVGRAAGATQSSR